MATTVTDRLFGENSSVAVKAPVVAVATSAITLSGLAAITTPMGSYTPKSGDRILVTAQSDQTTNGIYNANTSTWTRTGDFDGAYDVVNGTVVIVMMTTSEALLYQLTTPNPVSIGSSALTFASFTNPNQIYPQTAAEIAAGVTPTNYAYAPGDIRRYGAVAGGTVECATAFQNALNVAINGGLAVYVPTGHWKVSTTLTISTGGGISVKGDNQGASVIVNNVTGNPANPLFSITSQSNYFLFEDIQILGNGTTGAGGNGHAFAIINPSYPASLFPQVVTFSRVTVNSHFGNGKNSGGGSIPACALYSFGITDQSLSSCFFYNNCCGARYENCFKVHMSLCTIDGGTPGSPGLNNIYVDSCEDIVFSNGTLNAAGNNGSTDGNVFVTGTNSATLGFVLHASRAKNGIPAVVNIAGTASRGTVISDCELEQLFDPGSHTATMIWVGNGSSGVQIRGNYMLFANSFTSAIGVDVAQISAAFPCGGLEISGNTLDIGAGGTYLAGIRFNVNNQSLLSPVIRSNVFGSVSGAFTFTDAIRLNGIISNALIENNHFRPGSTGTITNCINIVSSSALWTTIQGNSYDTGGGGTITNQVVNPNSLSISRSENGAFTPAAAEVGPASSPVTGVPTDAGNILHNFTTNSFTYNLPAISTVGNGWLSPVFMVVTAGVITVTANAADKIGAKAAGSSYVSSNAVGNAFQVRAVGGGIGWQIVTAWPQANWT